MDALPQLFLPSRSRQPQHLGISLAQHDRLFNTLLFRSWSSPMNAYFARFVVYAASVLVMCPVAHTVAADAEWMPLFDGKTLEGWEKVGKPESVWEVKDGAISGSGAASMLVCTKGSYKNFRYRAEIKINDGGNSGLYF